MNKERMGIIIATKDRPDEVVRLLESIAAQGTGPVQTIVVDGGDGTLKDILDKFRPLKIDYARADPPSLTAQRNIGIKMLTDEVTIAVFLDDDIVLQKDSLKNMIGFWEGASADTCGASFNLINEIHKKPTRLEKMFLVNTDTPNRMLRSGFQGKVAFVEKTIPASWMAGCSMAFRKEIFKEFMFDEWFSGYARYEDVDFTYRVGKKYKMFVAADAKVLHLNRVLEDMRFSVSLGKMEVANRLYFVKKYTELSLPLCYWGLLGVFLNHLSKGLFRLDMRSIRRAFGNVRGLCDTFTGRSGDN
ncbi:MAG: glycosyltransferase [Candidatus Omnitrophota bacterium]